jgi:tRNA pseudouridine38-40 synthase
LRTLKLTVAYDGTAFHGWQRQPGVRTVQGALEMGVARVLGVEAIAVPGAGRTDAGVHARGQVASFVCDASLPARAFPPLLARELPDDVRVLHAEDAAPEFHARHSARARRYAYRLLAAPDVMRERYAWAPPRLPPIAALRAAAGPLAGTHDCSAFQAVGSSPADPVCRIHRAQWRYCEAGVVLDIVADHFLYHMVRNVVGTVLAAAESGEPAAHMRTVIESRDRGRGGITAPPEGLSLERVYYDGEDLHEWRARAPGRTA